MRRLAIALLGGTFALLVVQLALGGGTASAAPDSAAAGQHHGSVVVYRGGRDPSVSFTTRGGEVELDVTALAPGVDWSSQRATSAVVSIYVDKTYATDLVIPFSTPITRHLVLGSVRGGHHRLSLHFATDRSAVQARTAVLYGFHFTTYRPGDAGYLTARYTPVLYGRNLPDYGGPLDNAYSDTPLVAWHEATPAATPGHTTLKFSIIWSNEDGGTNTPQLMSRWGRSTDIEWIYQVEIDQNGNRVAGSDTYQAANHVTTYFHGAYEHDHAVLDTCTSNNNICDTVNDPMRFFLSAQESLPAGQPREHIMDTNPWTYQVMAAEMKREGKIEAPSDPATPQVSDQRNYLYLVVKKDTVPPGNSVPNWVGLALGVKLKNGTTIYRSDHAGTGGSPDWSIQRDDPAATTVELPAGTTSADIAQVLVYRVVNGAPDPGYSVHVTGVTRAFFLDGDYLPQQSFLTWQGGITLTAAAPSAVLWPSA